MILKSFVKIKLYEFIRVERNLYEYISFNIQTYYCVHEFISFIIQTKTKSSLTQTSSRAARPILQPYIKFNVTKTQELLPLEKIP
jgi:hypothetical protein